MASVIRRRTLSGELLVFPVNFGRYEVVRQIGVGTSAVIVEIRDIETRNRFAAKVMSNAVTGLNRVFRERELRLAKEIEHPCLVNVFEIITLQKVTVMVTELCHGGDIIGRMEDNIEDVVDRGCVIFRQVCEAVQYLHSRGIAHRDLKLENVLLVNADDVKLCDYGFICDEEMTSERCGTIAYMAPEVIQGRTHCPKKADVWSLGIMFHAMMTESLPYESDIDEDIMKEVLSGDLDFGDMTPDLAGVMRRMCHSDPSKRATIDEVLEMPVFRDAVDYRESVYEVAPVGALAKQGSKDDAAGVSKSHPTIRLDQKMAELNEPRSSRLLPCP